ncbi:hypothetical protein [Lysinibacillus sp. FSL M8-0355]|uniref:hypothetical protein n=1 Tax=Lysinibacillus sp. FSL M8-0355 TaxID=2921719 RepID=UPI0030F9B031
MIKIELSREVESKHLKYFEQTILCRFDGTSVDLYFEEYEDHHREFMRYCKQHYEVLAIGKPSLLKEFMKNIPDLSRKLLQDNPTFYRITEGGEKVGYCKYLLEIFNYTKFSELNNIVANEMITQNVYKEIKPNLIKESWNPYAFVMMTGIRICPYCNRQYITPIYQHSNIYSKKHKLRADLDHFYPKDKYPYLAMSLYNLVPCCKFCNSSLKNIKEFGFDDVNPYEANFDDYFKFKVNWLDEKMPDIYIEKTSDKSIDNYLDFFQIETLYKYHNNQAEELIRKRIIYSESYLEELYNNNKNYFESKEAIKELVIGYIANKGDFNNEAFSKLRRDISEQLNFIDYSPDAEHIDELKCLIKNK